MIPLQFFRLNSVNDLYENVGENLDAYRTGNFDHLLADSTRFIDSTVGIDEERILTVMCADDDPNEVACCIGVFYGLEGLTAYLARDERLWTRLAHIEMLYYVRTRWPIPADRDSAIDHVRKHFFAKGARGVERDNAVSRLWWMASICRNVAHLPLEEALKAFLFQSDVRANIVERPSTSQNPVLLSAIVSKLHESYHGDQALYDRNRFRSTMKKLNLEGGTRLLDVLADQEIEQIVKRAAQ